MNRAERLQTSANKVSDRRFTERSLRAEGPTASAAQSLHKLCNLSTGLLYISLATFDRNV